MPVIRDMPIRTKLTILLIGIVSLALMLICVAFLIHDLRLGKRAMVERLNALAHVLGNDCRDPLVFAGLDEVSARMDTEETLSSLRLEPTVVAACVYDAKGEVFATYTAPSASAKIPEHVDEDGHSFDNGSLHLTLPILLGEQRVGTIYLRESTKSLDNKLRDNVLMATVVFVICMGVVAILAVRLQRFISDPIQRLAEATKKVSEDADYSIRVESPGNDEIGVLINGFNAMLSQIQQRDRQLEKANRQLTEKNDELEQFIYTVSHDLKSPLVTCQGFVGLLHKDIASGNKEGMEDSASRIQKATRRMGELIEDLLQLSRIGRMPMEPKKIDVAELLQEVASDLTWQLKDAQAELVIEVDLHPVTADPVRLRQVFENLITNAIKYGTNANGSKIVVGSNETHDSVKYFVRDNGPGIAREYQDRIFRVFERLQKGGEGTGVGLAIVGRIMKRHGGRVWVESDVDQGATFWLHFPKAGVVEERNVPYSDA